MMRDMSGDTNLRRGDRAAGSGEAESVTFAGVVASVGLRGFLLILGFWTIFGSVMAVSLLLSGLRATSPPGALVVFTFWGAYTWAALTLPVFWLTSRLSWRFENPVKRFGALTVLGLLLAVLASTSLAVVSVLFIQELEGGTLSGAQGVWNIARYRFMHDLLAALLVIATGSAWDYFLRYQARQEEANILRAQLVESRLETLRTQLNPHFLFNTLNAVSALVTRDPKGVRRIIALLSDMLRYTLEGAAEPEIELRQELEILERYLQILEVRYPERLTTSITADPELLGALVPNLILQPLAENAVKHGISRAAGYGRIDVTAERVGADVVLSVRDTGPGGNGSSPDGPQSVAISWGIGLRHTRERLEQLYGDRSSLHLLPTPEGGMLAEIRLPFHTGARRAPAAATRGTAVPIGV
jgi:two-component system, LytTR family, sensor kinase